MVNGSVLVAIVATLGNLLQGWDNATIAGAVIYAKKEFDLGTTAEGLVLAMSLIGATTITTCSGTICDWLGRRPMLIMSASFYFISGLIMFWSPNLYVLLIARLLDGFGVGLAVTLIPLYVSEAAPSDIRGSLNTLPQFMGTTGMFFAYIPVFFMSLMEAPSWRLMIGVLSAPAVGYFLLAVFYLPESPRWLVSKGRMLEAKQVLQRLRGRDDVSAEMALLVEGLAVGGDTSIEEYIIGPANELADDQDPDADKDQIKMYGPEAGLEWVAKPVTGESTVGLASRHGSLVNQGRPLVDNIVNLFGSVHEKLPETGSMRSMLFPNFGSMFSMADPHAKPEQWDEESLHREGEDYTSDGAEDSDNNLQSPLISRQATSMEKDMVPPPNVIGVRRNSSLMQGITGEDSTMGIGGGWQLAWKWSERQGEDGTKEGGFKRIYLHEEGNAGSRRGSIVSLPGGEISAENEYIHAAALVSQPALYSKDLINQQKAGPAMVHPSDTVPQGVMAALLEPGVRRALIVGVGLQMLQQFAGINGVLYYTPQILDRAGVGVLLSGLGLSSDSSAFLCSGIVALLMLPCIAVAMRFVDVLGRRTMLLTTIPVVIASLIILIIANIFELADIPHAIISTVCIISYFCFFVMGYGPMPTILCSEIFPTRVRGICIAICSLVYWSCNIIVTYTTPVILSSMGLAGVFGVYAIALVLSLIFIYTKVPETKGMPLEVITEFFAVGARDANVAKAE